MFADKSPVEASALQPAKMLQWNISPETAADIQTASNSMNTWAQEPLISQYTCTPVHVCDIQAGYFVVKYVYICEGCFSNVRLVEDTDIACMTFSDFGKDFCKIVKLSPDGFIQIAIQLAFYK